MSYPDVALGESEWIVGRVAARARRRLAWLVKSLSRAPLKDLAPEAAPLLDTLLGLLRRLPAAERRRALHGPDLRGFLGEAETWIAIHRAAARPRSRSSKRAAGAGAATEVTLFDLVSRTEYLTTLVPDGRPGRGLPARARRLARRRLRDACRDLAAFVLGLRLSLPSGPTLAVDLTFREEPEQGRPRDRIDLGAVIGPAGPLAITATRRRSPPRRIRARVEARTLTFFVGGAPPILVPAAGSRLCFAARRPPAGPVVLERRETIPGSTVLLSPALRCRPRRLTVGAPVPGAGRRLAAALRLVQVAWPQAFREILLRTRMVVPVLEPGTVSWSLAARPGVSFINLRGKTILDLADDLLHETAHHHLHDRQELTRLLAAPEAAGEVQAFDSPWRRTRRPLHGILHGCFTFLFRAALLRRILRARAVHPSLLRPLLRGRSPAWIRAEIRREDRMIGATLRQLETAAREGLLTPAGIRLVRALRR